MNNKTIFSGYLKTNLETLKQNEAWSASGGLTKRELFAAMAMQGDLASQQPQYEIQHKQTAAKVWVEYADALIKELENDKS